MNGLMDGNLLLGSSELFGPTFLAGVQDFWRELWLRGHSASDIGRETDEMFMWLWWFCVAWFVGLMGITAYFVVRYRAKKGVAQPRSSSHNTPLEVAWTIVPTLFLVFIFFKGFWGYIDKMMAPGDATEISLTGFRWSWNMLYPNGGETNEETTVGARPVPVFYLPEDSNIRFRMLSTDVMHSFWVPDYRVKQDLLPNRYTHVWFRTAKVDASKVLTTQEVSDPKKAFLIGVPFKDHSVFCAEYCGNEHSEMAAVIRVVPVDAYRKWLEAIVGDVPPIQLGERVWKSKCMSCHSIDGKDGTGPTWKGIATRDAVFDNAPTLTAEQKADPTVFANYILESIRNPGAKVISGKGNNMAPYPPALLSEKQVNGVIEFMKSLSPAK